MLSSKQALSFKTGTKCLRSLIHAVVTDLQAKQLDTMKEKELILSGDG